jgi:hypothetical protein
MNDDQYFDRIHVQLKMLFNNIRAKVRTNYDLQLRPTNQNFRGDGAFRGNGNERRMKEGSLSP